VYSGKIKRKQKKAKKKKKRKENDSTCRCTSVTTRTDKKSAQYRNEAHAHRDAQILQAYAALFQIFFL
jgi:hypothetical protein